MKRSYCIVCNFMDQRRPWLLHIHVFGKFQLVLRSKFKHGRSTFTCKEKIPVMNHVHSISILMTSQSMLTEYLATCNHCFKDLILNSLALKVTLNHIFMTLLLKSIKIPSPC